ncbi:hypothetical protein G8S49_12015 [Clostridium botulinum C]|uniref:Uncharacterized protein n=3 Tax=Clostridium botulinum TaxID=1491 RepID=A0A9Q4XVJ8_CLOBO|nr:MULTISPECIES: hypothetical protein [Clostridium]EES92283.1 conserved hypothetical protein [Clostridium botulinum D str. 1873]KEI09259.1 hypothetical protein Z957_04965 [Clostridium sp. K25]MBO3441020.1 hypothetical protein [Clostridium haemolyticum]MCD3195861.1 hypothetical protein [Clostridium botulinum C]MCD3201277.1 hypothetical protein [Clostridium botulinum C]
MFNRLFNKIYFKRKKGEIRRGRSKLRRMKVDVILRILQKNCNNKQINYNVIEKNWDSILVLLKGKNDKILFKYHRTGMVFHEHYEEFLNQMKIYGGNKGVYITTGVFEVGLHKMENRTWFYKKVLLEDYSYFLKKQLGLKGKISEIFKNKKLNFYRYLPR